MSLETQTGSLRIELLGGFRITCGAHEIPDDGWRLAKARSLVKLVALAPGQSILREQLVELLWPELDPDAGANNLHQALHIARRTLGRLLPDEKPNRILRLQRGVLSLEAPVPIWIDVDDFERRARELQTEEDPGDFYATLDLYRGDLLPDDLYEDWAAERRIALHEQYLALLDRLARLHIARREATPAIDALRRIVAIEPDREEAHRSLMELYALTGRRQQALRQYERVREILDRELELEPEPETDDLYEAILSGNFPDETWEVEQPAAAETPARPEIRESIADFLGRAGDFVGRSEELGVLQGALERVIGGKGEIILVAGEPGIGKTRMSEEFLRYAGAQGVRTLWGRCYEGDGAPAYWPWVQVVRSYLEGRSTAELRTVMGPGAADIARIVPELRTRLPDLEEPPPLDPDGERFRLFDSMTTFLKNAAGRAPLALIIDDLHSADRSSLLLLEFLAREVAEAGLLILGTYRHVEVDRGHPLTRTLGLLARHEANERITLEGLSTAHIGRYIALVTGRESPEGLAAAIHDQSEGNPFFVREIVALLIEEERLYNPEDVRSWRLTIPHGIRETIALRTARLSDTAHRVLTTASVSGRDFELPIVAQVASLDELDTLDALEEALSTGLIMESPPVPGGFRFTHAITRETLYDDLSQARRLRMHLRTGEALEILHRHEPASHLLELAFHFSASAPLGSAQQAIEYLIQASRQALSTVAYGEAVRLYQQALDLIEGYCSDDEVQRCELLIRLGEALQMDGESRQAQEIFDAAVEVARQIDKPDLFAEAAVGAAQSGMAVELWNRDVIDLLEEALDSLSNHSNRIRVSLLMNLSRLLADDPDSLERRELLSAEAIKSARALDDPLATANSIYAQLRISWTRSKPETRLAQATEIMELAQLGGDPSLAAWGVWWRIYCHFEIGDFERAERDFEEFSRRADELRSSRYGWHVLAYRAAAAIARGDARQSNQLIEDARIAGQRPLPGPAEATRFVHRFALLRWQGKLDKIADEARAMWCRHDDFPLFACLLMSTLIECGEIEEARLLLHDFAKDEFTSLRQDVLWLASLALMAEAAYRVDVDAAIVQLIYQLLQPHVSRPIIVPELIWLGSTSHFLGLLDISQARPDIARQHLDLAVHENKHMGLNALAQISEEALDRLLVDNRVL